MTESTRREFLKQIAMTGAALAGLPAALEAAESTAVAGPKSRVIVAKDSAALKGNSQIVQSVVEKMLDRAMVKLTNSKTGVEAWKKMFSPKDVVGIKVSSGCGVGAATHPEVAYAVAKGLKSAGVKPENIYIWDRLSSDLIRGGYKPNKSGPGVRVYADDDDWGAAFEQGIVKGRVSKIISEKVTAIVNCPILKHHCMTGVTGCMKNHFGSFDSPSTCHDNCGDPAIADLNALPMIKDKTRLAVVDGIRPMYDGGPLLKEDAMWNFYSVLVSTDPLAVDAYSLKVVDDKRKRLKLPDFWPVMLGWLKAAQDRGVGVCDLNRIEIINA